MSKRCNCHHCSGRDSVSSLWWRTSGHTHSRLSQASSCVSVHEDTHTPAHAPAFPFHLWCSLPFLSCLAFGLTPPLPPSLHSTRSHPPSLPCPDTHSDVSIYHSWLGLPSQAFFFFFHLQQLRSGMLKVKHDSCTFLFAIFTYAFVCISVCVCVCAREQARVILSF